MPVIVPPYQNFVPGLGHKLMPSAHDVKEAIAKGEAPPEAAETTEIHTRAWSPVRKHGYENFLPGKGHKLMPTLTQLAEQEELKRLEELGEDPPISAVDTLPDPQHACTMCDKKFNSYAQLRGHQLHHRGS